MKDAWKAYSLIGQISLVILVPTIGFLFLGKWMDGDSESKIFTILLMLFGLSGGLVGAWRLLKPLIPKDKKEETIDLMANWNSPENPSEDAVNAKENANSRENGNFSENPSEDAVKEDASKSPVVLTSKDDASKKENDGK